MKKRVLLGLSGGGDSSVTAVLLKNQGYEVLGAFLKFSEPLPPETDYWEKLAQKKRKESGAYKYLGQAPSDDEAPKKAYFRSHCLQASNSAEALKICTRFDIPFYEIDCQEAFNFNVKDPFVHAMLNRRSIYPCGFCTRDLKIGMLLKKAEELGCEYIATGHYAQITQEVSTGQFYLRKSVDLTKDQTFELSGLDQRALSKLLTPLGGLSKGMVRKLAEEFGFQFRSRDEGQGCFLKSAELIPFLEQSTAPSLRPPGVVRSVDGDVVGEHDGLYQFQVGQTENLKLTMHDGKRKLQVVGFDPVTNVLVVGEKKDTQCSEVRLSDVNWLSPPQGLAAVRCKTKIQDLPGETESEVFCFENSTAHVYFKEPKDDVASGMRLIFLEGDRVLGCGTVERVEKV